jgi:cell division protease FtsH
VYGEVTTGAQNDMEHASNIARQIVGRWGMSPAIGPVSVLPPPGQESPYGLDGVAQATEELVDTEARKIIEECCGQALATLRGSRDRLDRLARTLLEREMLDEDDAYAAAGIDRETAPAAIARGGAPSTPQRRPSAAHASRGRTIRCGRDHGSHGHMRRGDTVTAEELLATGTWHQRVRWPM